VEATGPSPRIIMAKTPTSDSNKLIITLTPVLDREDKGMTPNYRVYAPTSGQTTTMKNLKGETIVKNTIMGGNGTIYIARGLSEQIDAWVLLPQAMYHSLIDNVSIASKKGKK
jgi:predicted ATP-grasp superfamily ATP-dependent carboligase